MPQIQNEAYGPKAWQDKGRKKNTPKKKKKKKPVAKGVAAS